MSDAYEPDWYELHCHQDPAEYVEPKPAPQYTCDECNDAIEADCDRFELWNGKQVCFECRRQYKIYNPEPDDCEEG